MASDHSSPSQTFQGFDRGVDQFGSRRRQVGRVSHDIVAREDQVTTRRVDTDRAQGLPRVVEEIEGVPAPLERQAIAHEDVGPHKRLVVFERAVSLGEEGVQEVTMSDDLRFREQAEPRDVIAHVVSGDDHPDHLSELVRQMTPHPLGVGTAGEGVNQKNIVAPLKCGGHAFISVPPKQQDVALDLLDLHVSLQERGEVCPPPPSSQEPRFHVSAEAMGSGSDYSIETARAYPAAMGRRVSTSQRAITGQRTSRRPIVASVAGRIRLEPERPIRKTNWAGLDIRQFRTLAALVDHGSMTAAAEALGVSQSTVSEALAALERSVGALVVARRRGAHGLSLTPAGRSLLPHARSVLLTIERAYAAVAEANNDARATFHIAANESISTYLLPPVLGVIRRKWPGASFAVTVGTCASVRAGVTGGGFDVGFLLEAEARTVSARGGLDAARSPLLHLGAARLVLFSTAGHPLRHGVAHSRASRDRLAPYAVFVTDAAGDFHRLLRDFFRADGLPGPSLIATGSVEGVKRSVHADPRALGVLPGYAVAEEFRKGGFGEVQLLPGLPMVRLDVAVSAAAAAHPAVIDLIEAFRSRLNTSS